MLFYRIVEEPDSTKRIVLKNAFLTGSEILSVRFDAEDSLVATGNHNSNNSINSFVGILN